MENKIRTYRRIVRDLIYYFNKQEVVPPTEEMDALWNSITDQVHKEKKAAKQHRLFIITASISAAAIVILAVGLGLRNQLMPQDISKVVAEFAKITVPDDEIRLIVSNDEIISLKKGATVSYSSDGSVSVDEKKVGKAAKETDQRTEEYNQIIVPKGKYTRLLLADGSSLHINAGTKVVYPRTFKKDHREIFVDGEIFIDVKRNESAPFFVKTTNFEVEVLGTAFNVNAYSEDTKAEVVLVRGLVNIKDKSKQEIQLSPNQLASIKSGDITEKHTVNATDYTSWTQGLLMLNTEPLESVLRKLQRYYGVNITFDASVAKLNMEGILDLSCPLPEVLRRLAVTAPISYHKTESGFIINRKSDE